MLMSTRELGNSGSILGVKDSSEQTKSIKYSQMTLEPKRKKNTLVKGKKNSIKHQNKSQRGRQEDGAKMMVLYCS